MQVNENLPVVLVVDDSQDTLDFITMGVEVFKPQFTVETASTGEEAVKKMNGKQYNAVILDVALPDMTGSMVAETIRKSNASIPMAFLTNYGGPVTQQNATEFNADFWYKPEVINDFEVLMARVCRLLGNEDCGSEQQPLEIREAKRATEPYKIPKFMALIFAER